MRHGLTMAPAALVLVLALVAAGPENPNFDATMLLDGRFGSRISPILLLARQDVQIELQLDARQISDARAMIPRLIKRVVGLKGKKGPEVEDQRRLIDEESIRWIRDNLAEKQIERLTQVTFQWEGASAMTRPHVIDRLALTDPQTGAIDQILGQLEEARRRARGTLTPSDIARFSSKAFEVLSPSQQAAWNVLLGRPCQFTIGGRPYSVGNRPNAPGVKAPVPSGG
jgi:hypothetical protein